MKTVQILNPETGLPFDQFTHGTTTYVAIPHNHPSIVSVIWEGPFNVCFTSDGEKVVCFDAKDDQVTIPLWNIAAPRKPVKMSKLVRRLFDRHHRRPLDQRLYAFSVTIDDGNPADVSKFKFHIFCPADYKQAQTQHLILLEHPDANGAESLEQKCDGCLCKDCSKLA